MGEKVISAIVLVGGNYDKTLLEKCLDSLSWTDEIVRVETDSVPGSFSEWRNYGAQKATGNWLFYVDSDEEVTPELREEIRREIFEGKFLAYAIPRSNTLLGKRMRHGGWWPDFVVRLIKKDALIKWQGQLHEQPKVKGEIGHLKEPLNHISHRSLTEMVEKTNKWSEIEAELLFKSGHPKMNIARFFSAGFREFWYRAVIKLGFLDGTIGVIEVFYQTYSRLITYAKLWEKQQSTIHT
ncbi:MAG: glycosyltransferase family 2 protein [Candidatus Woesebacteria bacterium]|nr:glycosyltransferase family 2 protein [Candidatus Woesebacteria bacterium]